MVQNSALPTGAVDPLTMRRTIGRFATGVAVVTTSAGGTPHGMTANSLTSVSLDPREPPGFLGGRFSDIAVRGNEPTQWFF